jgi:hypothetical protein
MLPGQDWRWCLEATNAFLIRAPERVLASYAAKREDVSLADIGFERQLDLFKLVSDHSVRSTTGGGLRRHSVCACRRAGKAVCRVRHQLRSRHAQLAGRAEIL